MRILSLHAENYKSIAELRLSGLGDWVALYGDNDQGKSNILETAALPAVLLRDATADKCHLRAPLDAASQRHAFGDLLRRGASEARVAITYELSEAETEAAAALGARVPRRRLTIEITITAGDDGLQYRVESPTLGDDEQAAGRLLHAMVHRRVGLVRASRRLGRESDPGQDPTLLARHTMPERLLAKLFVMKNSGDMRPHYDRLVARLGDLHPEIGAIDIVRSDRSSDLMLYVDGPRGRLPIASVGSGYQQAVLLLAPILLDEVEVVAIEEPEMNQSIPAQRRLRDLLLRAVRANASAPSQILFSTHSQAMHGDAEHFRVTFRSGATVASRERGGFPAEVFAEERSADIPGVRLTPGGAIPLPAEAREDLGLIAGDAVNILKNERTRRWEIWPARALDSPGQLAPPRRYSRRR